MNSENSEPCKVFRAFKLLAWAECLGVLTRASGFLVPSGPQRRFLVDRGAVTDGTTSTSSPYMYGIKEGGYYDTLRGEGAEGKRHTNKGAMSLY